MCEITDKLEYNPVTGIITNKVSRSGSRKIGQEAGCLLPTGYKTVYAGGRLRGSHRVAWFLHYGRWPSEIDHINQDRADNRIENLRECTRGENLKNKKLYAKNRSGLSGVSFTRNKWLAYIGVDGNQLILGRFNTLLDAASARIAAEHRYGYQEAHGKKIFP